MLAIITSFINDDNDNNDNAIHEDDDTNRFIVV